MKLSWIYLYFKDLSASLFLIVWTKMIIKFAEIFAVGCQMALTVSIHRRTGTLWRCCGRVASCLSKSAQIWVGCCISDLAVCLTICTDKQLHVFTRTGNRQSEVMEAFRMISSSSCIRFQQHTNELNYIHVKDGKGWDSLLILSSLYTQPGGLITKGL